MPSLSAYADSDELDNAIADKIIVYVEGKDDVAFYKGLAGPNVADRLEFKAPDEGSGYHQVKARVAELRPRNAKVHGLLDGEAAVSLGLLDDFLTNQNPVFSAGGEGLEGLVFLSENELENLILRHGGLASFISRNVPNALIGTVQADVVQREIDTFARRFYLFALIKFTMCEFHRANRPCKGVEKLGGKFLNRKVGVAKLLRTDVQTDVGSQVGWEEFLGALRLLAKKLKSIYDERGLTPSGRLEEAFRLADGKLLMTLIKSRFNGNKNWDGHLHEQLVRSDYCERFRVALFEQTGCNDNCPAV